MWDWWIFKNSEVATKGVLRNIAKFTGKHLCQSLFLNKVAGLRSTFLLKKRRHRFFPMNFAKFLRASSIQNTSGRLLLKNCTCMRSLNDDSGNHRDKKQHLKWITYLCLIVWGGINCTRGEIIKISENVGVGVVFRLFSWNN